MVEILDFSSLQNKYKFHLTMELVTPLHIGGTQDDAITSDSPIMRDAQGNPIIPGSSLKGVFRFASERTIHLLPTGHTCYLVDGGCDPKQKGVKIDEIDDEKTLYKKIYEAICPICKTYGGRMIASKVRFANVTFDKDKVKTRVRSSNSIDRERGTAKDRFLFTYEYINAGETFDIFIECENMTTENLQVLALALAQLKENLIRFGGQQAKGLGEVKLVAGHVEIEHYNGQNGLALLLGKKTSEKKELTQFLRELLLQEVGS